MENLTLIIPAKNEEESLPIFLEEIKDYPLNTIIIIPGNDQKTKNSIKNFQNLKIISQKKEGYGNAIIEGLSEVKTEYCCIINADGSMDPKYLEQMLKLCKENDLVFASRYEKLNAGSDDDTIITLLGNKVFSFLGNLLFNLNISDILYTYILGKTNSFKELNLESYDFRLCIEIPIKAKRKNYNYVTSPSYERNRIAGQKKVNALKDGFLILTEIIKYLFKIKK